MVMRYDLPSASEKQSSCEQADGKVDNSSPTTARPAQQRDNTLGLSDVEANPVKRVVGNGQPACGATSRRRVRE
jgi:hypothetical protein